MLEGLVAWVLNNYLGKYVENLNTDNLSIALLSGAVELENLPLKKDALRHLGLPIEIKAGFIGKVRLQIPVRQIRSAPWVIIIERLYLVATPLPVQEWDAVVENIAAQELKLCALDDFEAKWRLEMEAKDGNTTYYASTYSSWLNYGTGLITDVIENLQLQIHDVHIRYEDNVSVLDKAVAFGITVDSLSAQTCDENWCPGFGHCSNISSFKLLEMQKLAVYWTEFEYTQLFSKMNLAELAVAMSPKQNVSYNHHYILSPVSAHAHIKRNCSEQPLRSADNPRLWCDLQLEEVPLTLVDWQYDQIVQCVRGLDDIARYRNYRTYKPTCTVREDARAWWLYAISCHYPDHLPEICRRQATWQSCLQRARENVEYVKIYTKILATPNIAITTDETKLKDTIDWSRDFDELKVLRELSMRAAPSQSRNAAADDCAGRSMLVRWFPKWMGWYSSPSTESIVPTAESAQLEGEILQALNDSAENNTILKRDAVFGKFNFTLKSGTLSFCTRQEISQESVPMIELQFKTLCLNIVSKPRTASHLVVLSLGALYLRDKFTPNSLFPVLIGPPGHDRIAASNRAKAPSPRVSVTSRPDDLSEHLFYLSYEKRPENTGCDYRLCIRTKSLDVVYQPSAVKWLVEFLCTPHQKSITQLRIESMKIRTKKELMKNWEQILDGRVIGRKIWEYQLDITAPQIFFVEHFSDHNSAMAVVDFGRLQLRNSPQIPEKDQNVPDLISKESEDDDMFMTPCSTPPASEESDSESQPQAVLNVMQTSADTLTENLHHKIYDRYCVELTDLQILIGKVKDNWRYAHNKGTSTLHVLDRFNISLQIERRIIHTCDPMYPNLTLNANLPKLVAHLNEFKVSSARTLAGIISATGLPSPFNAPEVKIEDVIDVEDEDETASYDTSVEMSRLLTLQFTVDHMALEVQSRGRSVAELQVSGVKAAFTKRPLDVGITLTVHSLLLVDALQTFGPDFELLVASHKHVGMDSMSGSLRDSEPTSPMSPGSPDPNATKVNATSPVALTQALSSLASSPPLQPWIGSNLRASTVLDAEALITIEVMIVTGTEPMQIANIQFNNLDIIANQETIVELMGFVRRLFPEMKSQKSSHLHLTRPIVQTSVYSSTESLPPCSPKIRSTQLTFDFHRLNVLLLRGVVKDGFIIGKKICTATMSEAKIQAVVENSVIIEGSLGGLQILDLTPQGHMHQRIVSVGRDPLLDSPHPLYIMSSSHQEEERKAFNFKIIRHLDNKNDANKDAPNDGAEVMVRMASLWYTHSPQFVVELKSCATEFKQYLANLARSIKSAATDMALGLVHARAEALAQSLYMNSRLSASIYGSALSFSDFASPRRRRRSTSMDQSFSGYSSVKDSIPQTPYSPNDDDNIIINVKLDIMLDSPVVVLPRASNSMEVFVAHLGKITVNNSNDTRNNDNLQETHFESYSIEIRDMNLFSLDTSSRRVPGPFMSRSEIIYSCDSLAKPILHDTIVQLSIDRELIQNPQSRPHSLPNLLLDDEDDEDSANKSSDVDKFGTDNLQISGSMVSALKLSLTRSQYEQVLDTIKWLTSSDSQGILRSSMRPSALLVDILEEDTGVTTLNMDPHVRAKLFPSVAMSKTKNNSKSNLAVKVSFELPIFTIELRGDSPTGEQGLVDLSFRDFIFVYEKCHRYETNIQVSLRSIFMEDLLQPEGSKQRAMVVSSAGDEIPSGSACVSRSCPDIFGYPHMSSMSHGSLPDHLETAKVLGVDMLHVNGDSNKKSCPFTPPPSPSLRDRPRKNLVIISTLLVDSEAHNFSTYYNSIDRSTSVDFNCLDLVVSVESWVVVLDFFSASPSDSNPVKKADNETDEVDSAQNVDAGENVETNITVRSLTLVLVRPDRDVARANISNIEVGIKSNGLKKKVEGKLGSMSLFDLTLHGEIYREKFLTSGEQALHFYYERHAFNEIPKYDCQLKLKMSSVMYVHTKRFVVEIQSFFNHFTQLQSVMSGIRAATSGQTIKDEISRMSIILEANSPVLMLPVSSKSCNLLVGDFGELKVTNCFKYSGDNGTISVIAKSDTDRKCLMDVMYIDLKNLDLYAGFLDRDMHLDTKHVKNNEYFKLGSCIIRKRGASLLPKKCELKLQVERNLENNFCHNVPDMSIHGELSTLDASLDLSQYRLIRGLLANNLGENTEHILPSVTPPPVTAEPNIRDVWTLSSLRLDLLNVTVRLVDKQDTDVSPLACINFIKSRLTIESFSNLCQDIDLVSQEILINDTRFEDAPANKRSNIFTNILQPIGTSDTKKVQVEVHSRKRQDKFKFTILLNNMRLMAIFDWWMAAKEFILEDFEDVPTSPSHQKSLQIDTAKESTPFEMKLNITDSEIVVVENAAQWDTNAVILKSTTVLTYRPSAVEKPLSCNLNSCEMYSCILGMEDETALSIIDPVTLNMEVNKKNILEVQLDLLSIRLSYYDMQMFLQILNSLPKQMFVKKDYVANLPANIRSQILKLTALGFETQDCMKALELCEQKLEDAALWLTQNADPVFTYGSALHSQKDRGALVVKSVELKAARISICIIDDCGDADLPILEIALSNLNLMQYVRALESQNEMISPNRGRLECLLASDYYNRVLSGWEPIVEPWKCIVSWDHSLTSNLSQNRLQVLVESKNCLNVNITSTLMDLYKQVKESWLQDYYNDKDAGSNSKAISSPAYRKRPSFIPFSLRNETGAVLSYTTLITENNDRDDSRHLDMRWCKVAPGETVPFAFKSHDKIRHSDSHKMKMHQLWVEVEGYERVTPVTVDKVGVYFRSAAVKVQKKQQQDLPQARVVFDVALEGKARKLVTVRSALLIVNKLTENLEIKLESQLPPEAAVMWSGTKTYSVSSGSTLAVPLFHTHSFISVKPTNNPMFTYSNHLSWETATKKDDCLYELRACHTNRGRIYRFCAEIKRESYPMDSAGAVAGLGGKWVQPAHTITILPTVLLVNLLPIDLSYRITGVDGQVAAGSEAALTFVDAESAVELILLLDNFPKSTVVTIPMGYTTESNCRIKLKDNSGRKLYLSAAITPHVDAKWKITISAPYWIINKTGVPLVFKQGGVSSETAGQFDEHEIARMVAPLLFSFSDPDASNTVAARVGTHVIADGSPQWCKHFHLQRGIQVRRLHVNRDNRPDTVFVVGIEIRTGRGKYRLTNIVTISPRFQIHNKTSYQLLFAQSCVATNLSDPKAPNSYLKAMPDSYMPFHWPSADNEQLLSVLIQDVKDCCWSGGLEIETNYSMHVNIRDLNGRMYFLRLEVVLQGATFFVVFTDADTMPPPIRIDNFSEVSITFAQTCCKEIVHSKARAHASVPYAWDKPTDMPNITVIAPGGIVQSYDMNVLGEFDGPTYENFIYIAFTGTFKRVRVLDPLDVESEELVLDVMNENQVVLGRKLQGQRSQLWRMTPTGQLQHEGSSPPSHPLQVKSRNVLVLDIEGPAPQPSSYTRLMLRRPDPRRQSTQTWRFTDEGRLCCAHYNMCVQAQDGFFGLRQGNSAVLGLPQPVCHRTTESGIPLEQAVSRQRLRPGSGILKVEISMDGPTRVLNIRDGKVQAKCTMYDEGDWVGISNSRSAMLMKMSSPQEEKENKEMQFTVKVEKIGVSLISRKPAQELLFAQFSNLVGETLLTSKAKRFCISIGDIQIDNQLFESPIPVFLYVTPPNARGADEIQHKLPALEFTAEMQPILNENAVIFKYFIVKLKKLTIHLEERLLLKLFAFVGYNSKEEEFLKNVDESDYETQRMITEVAGAHARRYYFGLIQLAPDQIRLSMKTATKLAPSLHAIKKKLGLTFIKFEDAGVDLEPFIRKHPFDTITFLIYSIIKHFKDELMWQAGIILGSVDFLGNPIGFMNDVTEGVSGLLNEGNVGALVKNVAHGLSNSAAKVTESLSDSLGRVTMDDEHEERRQRIRQVDSGHGADHLVAGFKGLGFGLLGGATGIFKQVYAGASNEGVRGAFSGLGKGVLGAFTKPVVGVLDLASETARAVRDSSRNRFIPNRIRRPRCALGHGGLLPRYSDKQSLGQQHLYNVNERNYEEQLVSYEILKSGTDDLRVIVSNQWVRIVTSTEKPNLHVIMQWPMSELEKCRPVHEMEGSEARHYIELFMHIVSSNQFVEFQDPYKKRRVRCESEELAKAVSRQINYAKRLHDERLLTLTCDNITQAEA